MLCLTSYLNAGKKSIAHTGDQYAGNIHTLKVIRTDKHMQHICRMLNAKLSAFSQGRDSCEMFLNRPESHNISI